MTLVPVTAAWLISKLKKTDFNLDTARVTDTLIVGGTIAWRMDIYVL